MLLLLPASAAADVLDELAALMQGRFDTHAGDTSLPAAQRLVDSRQRVVAPAIGPVVFYLQLNRGAALALYRQRLLVFAPDGSGNVVQRAYTLNDATRFVDAEAGDPVLAGLTMADVTPMFERGCGQLWTRTSDGFRGYTDPGTCRIISGRTSEPRRIEAETALTAESLSLAERGYDDDMKQLFGTPPGTLTLLQRIE